MYETPSMVADVTGVKPKSVYPFVMSLLRHGDNGLVTVTHCSGMATATGRGCRGYPVRSSRGAMRVLAWTASPMREGDRKDVA